MAITKPAGSWTYEDLFSLPDDGRRYEIIEGELYEMPAPNLVHATVVMNLIALLLPIVSSLDGRLFTAPLDVFFQGADPVQPDIVVILPGWSGNLPLRGPEGAPDLLIEVLSPANRGHDLLTKRALYARAGVREYWIVDPTNRTVAGERHVVLARGRSYDDVPPLRGIYAGAGTIDLDVQVRITQEA